MGFYRVIWGSIGIVKEDGLRVASRKKRRAIKTTTETRNV